MGSKLGSKSASTVKSSAPKSASATKMGAKGGPPRQVNSQPSAAAAHQISELQAEIATLQNQVCACTHVYCLCVMRTVLQCTICDSEVECVHLSTCVCVCESVHVQVCGVAVLYTLDKDLCT